MSNPALDQGELSVYQKYRTHGVYFEPKAEILP